MIDTIHCSFVPGHPPTYDTLPKRSLHWTLHYGQSQASLSLDRNEEKHCPMSVEWTANNFLPKTPRRCCDRWCWLFMLFLGGENNPSIWKIGQTAWIFTKIWIETTMWSVVLEIWVGIKSIQLCAKETWFPIRILLCLVGGFSACFFL